MELLGPGEMRVGIDRRKCIRGEQAPARVNAPAAISELLVSRIVGISLLSTFIVILKVFVVEKPDGIA